MPIRWDSLLVRHLAGELHQRLEGRRLRALRLEGDRRDLVVLLREETLVWRLHPTRGHLAFYPPQDPGPGDLPLSMKVRGVSAPPDERIIFVELVPVRGRRAPANLVVELLGNQWNALVAELPDKRIRHVLHTRRGPVHAVGSVWTPPEPSPRQGAESLPDPEAWQAVQEADPDDARRRLVATLAWTSPLNAPYILGGGPGGDAALEMEKRWRHLTDSPGDHPVVLLTPKGPQPYPLPLPGTPSEPAGSLVEAFQRCLELDDGTDAGPPLLPSELLQALESATDQADRRVTRLEAELDGLGDEHDARSRGDLILARFHLIEAGAEEVVLEDFQGAQVRVSLDPKRSVQQNAEGHYDEAARIVRARETLPGLIQQAREQALELRTLLTRAQAGEATADEVKAGLPARRKARGRAGAQAPSLPYHVFRSSGGLEIRVGRGAKHNDDLTFRHSAPGDVWLHARHAAGAHVILRWSGDGAPPTRDLHEAAVLAALNSRARTSGTVPVDWTLRKHVRKPRGAPPGSVVPQRVKTVFVEPDEELLEKLAPDR